MLAGLVLVLALALGAVQLGSDAVFARAGEPISLPAHLHPQLGVSIYRAVARIAQAPYVDGMLARAALDRGDAAHAQQYALLLPPSGTRDDLLGFAAQARGDDRAALQYFVSAGDIEAIDSAVDRLQYRDPAYAYRLESGLKQRLEQSGTHPDAVAEAYWQLGRLAWMQSQRKLAMHNYERAIALSPLSEKFLLSGGFSAYEMHQYPLAQSYFQRVLSVNPASPDAYAGAGMVAFRMGDRARARYYAQRARAINPRSHPLLSLESMLHP